MKQLLDKNGNKMTEIVVVPIWKKIVYVAVLYTCPFIIFLKLKLLLFSPIITEKIRAPHPFLKIFRSCIFPSQMFQSLTKESSAL